MKKLVALLLTFLLVLLGCNSIEVTKVEDDIKTDSIRFNDEYKSAGKNNIYEYATYDNVIERLNKGTGIIYLGFPTCSLCKEIVPILDEVAKKRNIDNILYYNFKDIRNDNTKEYQELVDILSDYLKEDEEKNLRISAPTVIFVNKGRIVGVYIGKISPDSEEIITEEEKINLKNNFLSLIDKMSVEDIEKEEQN